MTLIVVLPTNLTLNLLLRSYRRIEPLKMEVGENWLSPEIGLKYDQNYVHEIEN